MATTGITGNGEPHEDPRHRAREAVIAALFVERGGVYWDKPGIEAWDKERDARKYAGPWPVVAHPPCERWGSFWRGSPIQVSRGIRFERGDDGGCFQAAYDAVRRYGGVIEHPRGSHAWKHFGIPRPDNNGGWIELLAGGWTCCVYQGHYGHKALKPTWLYYYGAVPPPELKWGKPEGEFMSVTGTSFATVEDRRKAEANGWKYKARLPTKLRNETPIPFRDLLLEIAGKAPDIERAAKELAYAWQRYIYLFCEPPHGTEQQIAAMLELLPRPSIIRTLPNRRPGGKHGK